MEEGKKVGRIMYWYYPERSGFTTELCGNNNACKLRICCIAETG